MKEYKYNLQVDDLTINFKSKHKLFFDKKPIVAKCLGCGKIDRYDLNEKIKCCKNKAINILEISSHYLSEKIKLCK